jgi:hypothetical protein
VAAHGILSALGRREIEAAGRLARESEVLAASTPNLDFARGCCALVKGDLLGAANHLERALAWTGDAAPYAPLEGVTGYRAQNVLSEVRYLQGREADSVNLYHEARVSYGRPLGNAFHGPVQDLVHHGDPGLALLLLGVATQRYPTSTSPWKRGGELFLALGLKGRAEEWLIRASRLSPHPEEIEGLLDQARSASPTS